MQTQCIDDQDKFQSVTDTVNEFTECKTPRRKLQSIVISPVTLHAFMTTWESDILEAYTSWLLQNSKSDSYEKNDMKEKVSELVRLHRAMQEKLKTASYSQEIQILALLPDKWSRMYCLEYFNAFEYFVWTSHKIKNVAGILAKPAPKKGKTISTETLHLVTNV